MTKKIYSAVLLNLFSTMAAVQADEKAFVDVYLFKSGEPLPKIEVIADGLQNSVSDQDGYAALTLAPGKHHVVFKENAKQILDLDLPLAADENVQMIVTTFSYGQKPKVEIESSKIAGNLADKTQEDQPKASGKGVLEGEVINAETKKPVVGAQVFISGLATEIKTDKNGKFKTEIGVGEYSISVLHANYSTQIKDKVPVLANTATNQPFELTPRGLELPEYVVIEPHIAGSLASVIEEQRTTSAVSNIMGAEQITRNGDSDAAGALRRATGLTLVGGRFVFIRGLGERYSSTLLNGISIPSPDPTRRVVPLNLFPTSVLDSILIQKSYSVDRQGEFAGGTVELRTKSIPDDFFFKLAYQSTYNDGTTFKDGLRYKGGDYDFLGSDDGTRALPGALKEAIADGTVLKPKTRFNPEGFSTEQMDSFGRQLSGVWDINKKELGPNHRVNLGLGDVYRNGNFGIGYTGTLRWSDAWDNQDEILNEYSYNSGRLDPMTEFKMSRTQRQTQANGYLGWEANYTDHHKIFGKALILRQTFDEARITQGYSDSDATDIRRSRLRYIENSLLVGQWGGEHALNRIGEYNLFDGIEWLGDIKLNWIMSKAAASRSSPNEREYRYDKLGDKFYFSRRADSNQSVFSELADDDKSFRMDISIPLKFKHYLSAVLSSGFIDRTRKRDSSIRRFGYTASGSNARDQDVLGQSSLESILSDDMIGNSGFVLKEITRATDNYKASQELFSYYGQGDFTFFDLVRLTGGVRIENNNQKVSTFELFNPDHTSLDTKLVREDLLPSASATIFMTDKQQIRFGYSETLSRPDFRELSPAPFTDPNNDRETLGNPDLKQTEVTSYDVRWEYYFSGSENLTLGAFNKELTNPIETILLPGPAGLLTLQNAKTANVYGFEAEALKKLDFISPKLEHFYIGGNYTWSSSQIELKPENLQTQTTNFRPLQGHSKYIINTQIGYDNPNNGITATLLYNTIGKRITEVGSLGAPDKYEKPFNQLDFVFRYKFKDHYTLTLNAKNLLDDTVLVTQADKITRKYKRGRQFRLGISVDF